MSSNFLPQRPQVASESFANHDHFYTLEELEYNSHPRPLGGINDPHYIPDNTPFFSDDEKEVMIPSTPPPLETHMNMHVHLDDWSDYYFYDDISNTKPTQFYPSTDVSVRSNVDSLDEKQITVSFSGQQEDFRPRTLQEVCSRNLICSWALKKHTSIKLQEFLPSASDREMQVVWNQIASKAVNLSCDTYGNMFMQKFLVNASPNLRKKMALHLTSHVAEMSQNEFGCWVIQKAIATVDDIGDIWMESVVDGRRPCLSDTDLANLIVCKHGHYVIEKLLEKICLRAVERIERVLSGKIRESCIDQCGYHVVLKIFDRATSQFQNDVIEEVLKHCLLLSKDQFGNFVIKRVIEMGDSRINSQIGEVVLNHLERLSLNKFGSHVVEALLKRLRCSEMTAFVDKLLDRSDKKLIRFLKDQTGNYVVQKMIAGASRRDVKKMKQRLDRRGLRQSLENGRGSHVIEKLEKKLKNN